MSFATEVKKELLNLDITSCCKNALVAGILQGNGEIIIANKQIKLQATSFMPSVIRYIAPFIKQKFDIQTQTSFLEKTNINKKRIYLLEIVDDSKPIIDEYHLMPFDTITIDDELLENDCCKRAFIRGCFIAK